MSSGNEIRSVVHAAGFRPTLRPTIKFLKGPKEDIVVVHDTKTGRRFELYEVECIVAKAMNGSRNLEGIAKATKGHVPWATNEQIGKVVTQLAGMGLVAEIKIARLEAADAAAIRKAAPSLAFDIPNIEDDEDDEDEPATQIGGPAAFGPPVTSSGFEEEEAPLPGEELPPLPGKELPPLPGKELPPLPGKELEQSKSADQADSMEHFATQEAGEFTIPQAPAPSSEEDVWKAAQDKFYRAKWFKRLIKIVIFFGIIAALGFIPYPIRVTEQCLVVPALRADVRAEIDGIITEIFVSEGETVEKGQILARLDGRAIEYELRQASAEVSRLEAKASMLRAGSRPEEIKQAKTKVSSARRDLAIAGKRLKRVKALLKNRVGSENDVEEARGEMQMRSQALKEANASLRLVEAGFRSEQVKVAEAELEHATAEVAYLEQKLELLDVRAPLPGKILTPRFRENLHKKISAGDSVVEIGDAERVRVQISLSEDEADIIAIGQPVEVKVHSYPLETFTGVVAFVAPVVEVKSGSGVIRVDAMIENREGRLLPRMTGYAEINTGNGTVLSRISRRLIRWVRVRFLI